MNSQDYFRFLLGRADTIDRLARDPSTPWVGLALALLAGIPREYDQESLFHGPWYFLLPVLASLVLGLLYHVLLKGNGLQQTQRSEWQFLGLIWATAPLAWLYAIPVERFLDPLNAARANVALLAVVGTWRVLLFARVVHVLSGLRYSVVLAQFLFLASIPILLSAPFRTIPLVGLMSGVLRTPAMDFLLRAQNFTTTAAFYTFLICLGSMWMGRHLTWSLPAPHPTPGKPWGLLVTLSVLGSVLLAWGQPALIRYETMLHREASRPGPAALRALATLGPEGIPPTRKLPFTGGGLHLVGVDEMVGALEESTPAWLREAYLRDYALKLGHERYYLYPGQDLRFRDRITALSQHAFGRAWLREHQEVLRKVAAQLEFDKPRAPLSLETLDRLRDTDFAPLPPAAAPAPTP